MSRLASLALPVAILFVVATALTRRRQASRPASRRRSYNPPDPLHKLHMARLDGKGKLKTHVFNNDAKGIGFKHSKTCTNKKPSA